MKLADYSDRVTADQLDTALRQGGFEGVFHYLKGTPGFVIRLELADVVASIRLRGWPQAGIDVPFNPADADGAGMADTAAAYGFPAGSRLYLDIEPGRFALTPLTWAVAADAWCDAVRAGGFSPGVYGTDTTVAACANHADTIWRAKPDACDPAGPGLDPAFFIGRRAVQCAQEVHNGVSFDVSYSQFALGGAMTQAEFDALLKGNIDFQALIWRVEALINNRPTVLGGPTAGEVNQLEITIASLANVATIKPVLDAIAALKADLDALTLKRA